MLSVCSENREGPSKDQERTPQNGAYVQTEYSAKEATETPPPHTGGGNSLCVDVWGCDLALFLSCFGPSSSVSFNLFQLLVFCCAKSTVNPYLIHSISQTWSHFLTLCLLWC
ncbi:unnamed protein product [Lepidochelys olivacea]